METIVDTTIVDKLKKLLTLSKGATGAEAETALAMAMKLATKHEIDISSIELGAPEAKKEEMKEGEVGCGARMHIAQKWISWLLQEHFKVNIVYSGSRYSGRRLFLFGRKSDVEFAQYVNEFLKEHMLRSWQYYQKTNKVETRYRASYFSGFHRGLSQKLAAAKREATDESFAAVSDDTRDAAKDRYALAIVSEKEARAEFVAKRFPTLRSMKSRTAINYNSGANGAGFAAGHATNIARPLK